MSTKLRKKDAARMLWARKAVNLDMTTRYNEAVVSWPVQTGGWVYQDGPADGKACGVGLHLGKTARGLSSAHRLAESLLLAVGYLPGDVLGEDGDKVRVSRCWVAPGSWSFPEILRNGWGRGADLEDAYLVGADLVGAYLVGAYLGGAYLGGADLGYAYLRGAYLVGAALGGAYLGYADLGYADLGYAYLRGADLGGAYLVGANLVGAYLEDARADRFTRWPAGFDAAAAGVTVL